MTRLITPSGGSSRFCEINTSDGAAKYLSGYWIAASVIPNSRLFRTPEPRL
jgi:hypothetical protein